MVSLVFFLVFREESLKEVSRVLFCPPYSHHCRRPGPVSFLRRKYISHSYHGPMRRDPRDSVRSCPLFIACPAQTRYQYVIKARTKPRWAGVGRGGLLASQNTSFTSHHSPGAVHVQVLCVYAAGAPSGEVAQQQPVRARASLPTWRRRGPDSAREPADDESSFVGSQLALYRHERAALCASVRVSTRGDQPPTHPAALLGLAKFAFWGQGRSVVFCFLRPAAASSVGKGQTHGVGPLSLTGSFHRFIPIRTLHPLLCLVCLSIHTYSTVHT